MPQVPQSSFSVEDLYDLWLQYGEINYWNERYKEQPNAFEWYQGYAALKPLLNEFLPKKGHHLQVGVGTSLVQQDMAEDDYELITNVDYSDVAIDSMKEQCPQHLNKNLIYQVVDCREMKMFEDNQFDGVFDKGTLDAILCGDDSYSNAEKLLKECYRVLKPDRYFLIITYGDPQSRLVHFNIPGAPFDVKYYTLTKTLNHGVQDLQISEDVQTKPAIMQGPFKRVDDIDAVKEIRSSSVHYVYVCQKLDQPQETENQQGQDNLQ
eukprot:TRINITY_DN13855_c1_g1_i1.p1 TRINITY_DN13855_c1_g1~~TRINITY_DN13855_c1_g1_i1.p1  ORF type:complete len:265 (-),score=23.61 TRINITY_DN13855_c1_g1_i1:329-1123(-)